MYEERNRLGVIVARTARCGFEAYAAVDYGKRGGEFRFVVPNIAGYDPSTFGIRNEPPVVMLGLQHVHAPVAPLVLAAAMIRLATLPSWSVRRDDGARPPGRPVLQPAAGAA